MVNKIISFIFGKQAARMVDDWRPRTPHAAMVEQRAKQYISQEAAIGAQVLGPIPAGHTREFFCLDRNTWIWRENWRDENGTPQQFIVNYEVDPSGILKRVNGGQYSRVEGAELARFDQAIRLYYTEVAQHVYGRTAPALA